MLLCCSTWGVTFGPKYVGSMWIVKRRDSPPALQPAAGATGSSSRALHRVARRVSGALAVLHPPQNRGTQLLAAAATRSQVGQPDLGQAGKSSAALISFSSEQGCIDLCFTRALIGTLYRLLRLVYLK